MQGMRIKGGVSLFQKEIPLPYTHPEKIYIAGFKLEGLHALRNRVRCTWLRHEYSACRFMLQPRALRSARVTVERRQTAYGRHCYARRITTKTAASAVVFFFDLTLFRVNIVDMLEQNELDALLSPARQFCQTPRQISEA